MSIKTIVIASNNAHKIQEIGALLKPFEVEIKSLKDLNLGDPVEDGRNFVENSLIKAQYAFEKTGIPSLADDSGFCVESINDFPGVSSARFANAVGGYEKAFEIINACINERNKKCHFSTCISFVYNSDGKEVKNEIFEGTLRGNFIYPPRGNQGFGYDPCFMPNGFNKTLAEISMEEKNKISHRAIALTRFIEYFKNIK